MSQTNNNKDFELLKQEYINCSFGASLSIRLIRNGDFLNVSIATINGLKFKTDKSIGMSVQLSPKMLNDFMTKLKKVYNFQFMKFEEMRKAKQQLQDDKDDDW